MTLTRTVFVQTLRPLIVILLATPALSQELNSTLHSTLYGVEIAYVDEIVVFTCMVRGTNSMAWTSEEYIGTGGQRLEFSTADPAGTTMPAVGISQTVATLVNAMTDEIIVSQLSIRIRSNIPTASIWCHNINTGTNTSVEFLLADTTSIECDKQSACPGETVTCTCTTANSTSLTWTNSENSVTFTSTDDLGTRRNVNGASMFAILTDYSNRNGIRVITSNLTFVTSSSMRFTCENVDRSTSESTIIPISATDFSIVTRIESCINPTSQVTTPTDSDSNLSGDTCTCTGRIVAAVIVPVIIIIIVVSIIVIVLILAWYKIKALKGDLSTKDKTITKLEKSEKQLMTDNERQEETIDGLNGDVKKLKDELSTMSKTLRSKIYECEQANREINELRSDMNKLRQQLRARSTTQSN